MRRCAVEETGKDSVIPWTNPRTIAWTRFTAGTVQRVRPGLRDDFAREHAVDAPAIIPHQPGPLAVDILGHALDHRALAFAALAPARTGVPSPGRQRL